MLSTVKLGFKFVRPTVATFMKPLKIILLGLILSACATTSIMGGGFVEMNSNTYLLQVGTSGTPQIQSMYAESDAKHRLNEEAIKFISQNPQFKNYKILNIERSIFPLTYYKFTVEFY